MEKLVCIKCGGTKWTEGQHLVYTVMPAVHSQEYICSNCGYNHTIETRERLLPNNPREVFVDSTLETKSSKMESDTSVLSGSVTISGITSDISNQPIWTTKK